MGHALDIYFNIRCNRYHEDKADGKKSDAAWWRKVNKLGVVAQGI